MAALSLVAAGSHVIRMGDALCHTATGETYVALSHALPSHESVEVVKTGSAAAVTMNPNEFRFISTWTPLQKLFEEELKRKETATPQGDDAKKASVVNQGDWLYHPQSNKFYLVVSNVSVFHKEVAVVAHCPMGSPESSQAEAKVVTMKPYEFVAVATHPELEVRLKSMKDPQKWAIKVSLPDVTMTRDVENYTVHVRSRFRSEIVPFDDDTAPIDPQPTVSVAAPTSSRVD